MKDYSEYIKTPFGYITHYEITGDKIEIYTARSEKNKPHVYALTDKNLKKYDERLGKQYQLLHEHSSEIKDSLSNKLRLNYLTISAIILMLNILASVIIDPSSLLLVFAATSTICIAGGETCIHLWQLKFESTIKIQKKYLKERESIEALSKQDENITACLSEPTKQEMESKRKIKSDNNLEVRTLDVDFMDKVSLKELRSLINRYLISADLAKEPTYQLPEKNKKRTRTLTSKKN